MPFSDFFRSKEQKLEEAIQLAHSSTITVSVVTSFAMDRIVKENWHTELDSSGRFALLSEWYYFYAHMMDWFAFGILGEKGRDLLADYMVELGIVPFVRVSWPSGGDEFWEPLIADCLSTYNKRQFEYTAATSIFSQQPGGVPGLNDALSESPEAKVSCLFQELYTILEGNVEGFESRSEKALTTSKALGIDLGSANRLEIFLVVQNMVVPSLNDKSLTDGLRQMHRMLR